MIGPAFPSAPNESCWEQVPTTDGVVAGFNTTGFAVGLGDGDGAAVGVAWIGLGDGDGATV
jgi:hypothetical protein